MSVECEPGAAEGGAFARAHPPGRAVVAATVVQFARLGGAGELPDAAVGEHGAGFVAGAECLLQNAGAGMAASAAALRPAAVPSFGCRPRDGGDVVARAGGALGRHVL